MIKTINESLTFMFDLNNININPPRRSINEFPGFNQQKFKIYSNNNNIDLDNKLNIISSQLEFNTEFSIKINNKTILVNNLVLVKKNNILVIKTNKHDILYFSINKISLDTVLDEYCMWDVPLFLTKYSKQFFNTTMNIVGAINLMFTTNSRSSNNISKKSFTPIHNINPDNIKRYHKTKNHFIKFKFFETLNTSCKHYYEFEPSYCPEGKNIQKNKIDYICRSNSGFTIIKNLKNVIYANNNKQIINFNNGFKIKYNSKTLDLTNFNIWFSSTSDSKPIIHIATGDNQHLKNKNIVMFKSVIGGMYAFNNDFTALNILHIEISPTEKFYNFFNIPSSDRNSTFGLFDLHLELDTISTYDDNKFPPEQNIVLPSERVINKRKKAIRNTRKDRGCDEGYVLECTNHDWCIPVEWVGDGYCDNMFIVEDGVVISADLSCYSLDIDGNIVDVDDTTAITGPDGGDCFSQLPWTPLFFTIKNTSAVVGSNGPSSAPYHAVASDSCNVTPWFLKSMPNSIYGPRDLFWDEVNHNLDADTSWIHMTGIYSTCYSRITDNNGIKMMVDIAKGAGKSGFFALSDGGSCNNSCGNSNSNVDLGPGNDCDSNEGNNEDASCEQNCYCYHSDNGPTGCQSTGGTWLGRGCSDLYWTNLNFAANIPRQTCKASRGVFQKTHPDSVRNARINLNIADDITISNLKFFWQRWYIYPNVPAYLPPELLYDGNDGSLQYLGYNGCKPKNFKFITQNIFEANAGNTVKEINVINATNGTNTSIGSKCILDLLWDNESDIPQLNSNSLTEISSMEFEYYSEHLTYYDEKSIYKPPNYGTSAEFTSAGFGNITGNGVSMSNQGGPILFSNTVVGCIRVASSAKQIDNGQWIYTYNILNHDFDPQISKIIIPNSESTSNHKIWVNTYDELTQLWEDSTGYTWIGTYDPESNNTIYKVVNSSGEEVIYNDPEPTSLLFSDNITTLGWGTVSVIQFYSNNPPVKGNINLFNHITIEDINTNLQEKYGMGSLIENIEPGKYKLLISGVVPQCDNCKTLTLTLGWNLISGLDTGCTISDPLGIIIPDTLFTFSDNGYEQIYTTLSKFTGYWIKTSSPGDIEFIPGVVPQCDNCKTLTLTLGWNLISGLDTGCTISDPLGIIIPDTLFTFSDNGYEFNITRTTLSKFTGYWIKTSSPGDIEFIP